ncbi:hypothetical protein SAMN05428954_7282 [Streptomyces sp. 2112.3]|nr:hypothetical protein SAMN05428954_0011 [Streptomyces sp. 2112.3]SEF18254.1 hypothetical protein SAMN05428954_7282 [Streptomyces sp. 2112.3]
MAEMSGIAASTLRACNTRGEADVPLPQAVVGGRSAWARPVAQDWIEHRSRSADSVAAAMATSTSGDRSRRCRSRLRLPLPRLPTRARSWQRRNAARGH